MLARNTDANFINMNTPIFTGESIKFQVKSLHQLIHHWKMTTHSVQQL